MVADRASSHANLAFEFERIDQDQQGWQTFLQTRAVVKAADKVADDFSQELGHPALHPVGNGGFLYRVPVQVRHVACLKARLMSSILAWQGGSTRIPTYEAAIGEAVASRCCAQDTLNYRAGVYPRFNIRGSSRC